MKRVALSAAGLLALAFCAWVLLRSEPGDPRTRTVASGEQPRPDTDDDRLVVALPALESEAAPVPLAAVAVAESQIPTAPLTILAQNHDTGAPVEAARVRIVSYSLVNTDDILDTIEGITDATGIVTLTPAIGTLRVSALSDSGLFGQARVFHTGAPAEEQVTVQMDSLATIAGVVLDDATSAPIQDATIDSDVADIWSTPAHSDTHGYFELPSWRIGPGALLTVHAVGYCPAFVTLIVDKAQGWSRVGLAEDIEWSQGEPFVEVRLLHASSLHGRAVNEAGAAIGGVKASGIGLFESSFAIAVRDRSASVTDKDGSFTLASLRPDIPHLVTLGDRESAIGIRLVPPSSGNVDIGDVTLVSLFPVAGEVIDSQGRAVTGANVALTIGDYEAVLGAEITNVVRSLLSSISFQSIVGADGGVSLACLPGVDADVVVSIGRREVGRKQLHTTSVGPYSFGRIVIDAPLEFAHGLLIDANGKPRADAPLLVFTSTGHLLTRVVTATTGRFTFAILPDLRESLILLEEDDAGRIVSRWSRGRSEFPVVLHESPAADADRR